MTILKRFDALMSHLNGEENGMAEEFRAELVEITKTVQDAHAPNFDYEEEHWENGNFDDSFEYGCSSGRASLAATLSKHFVEGEEDAGN